MVILIRSVASRTHPPAAGTPAAAAGGAAHPGRAVAPWRGGPSVAAAAAGQLVGAVRPAAIAAIQAGGAVDRGRDRGRHRLRAPPVAAPGALPAGPTGPVGVRRAAAHALNPGHQPPAATNRLGQAGNDDGNLLRLPQGWS